MLQANSVTLKIALPVILAGLFIVVVFAALHPTQLDLSFYVVLALVAVFIFFYGVASGQKLAMPVKKLLNRAIELSGGDLTARVYLDSKDEFEELAKLFNKIAEELQRTRAEAEITEKSVDIKVRARTQALEETINALEQKIKNRTVELERLVKESSKLQEDAKNREVEAASLKRELGSFKQKLGKYSKPKKEADSTEENEQENTNE
jgi:methyl-accepting chemotaxis protein